MYFHGIPALVLSIGLLAASGTAPASSELTLDPRVQETIRVLLKDYRPPAALVVLTETREVKDQSSAYKVRGAHTRQASGLWASSAHTLHLCGLVVVLNVINPGSTTPLSGTLAPFTVRDAADASSRSRVLSLESSSAQLCAPEPGSSFTYRFEHELWVRTPSLPEGALSRRSASETACKAAAEFKPARDLGLPVAGDALLVSCQSPGGSANQIAEYAFVKQLGLYLLLSAGDAGQTPMFKSRYDAVDARS